MPKLFKTTLLFCLLATLTGCAVGPDYQRPDAEIPRQFKEWDGWKTAEPNDEEARGAWWERYGDAELNALVTQIDLSNQNIRVAVAQVRQAQATLDATRANYWPNLGANFAATRATSTSTNASSNAVNNTVRPSLSATWEPDVWGSIQRSSEANTASVQASRADLEAVRLAAQATLVQSYLQLRVSDAQKQLLDETVRSYQRSLTITQEQYAAGFVGRLDVTQAQTQLKSAQAAALDLGVQRAQLEHAIALLIGKAPADFSLTPAQNASVLPALPEIPPTLPSALLERRPDVAAAERHVAAANAQIGVAQAAFFPSLSFSASGGYQSSSLSQLLTLPNRFWSLGPALALTLFDGGARSAQKESAIAVYDQKVATYRQTILIAFQDVEDNLAALRILAEEANTQQEATELSEEALRLTLNQYQSGTVSYLAVVTAQVTALNAQTTRLSITGRRLVASANLLKALGGDWWEGKRVSE